MFVGFTYVQGMVEEALDESGRALSYYGFHQDYAVPGGSQTGGKLYVAAK